MLYKIIDRKYSNRSYFSDGKIVDFDNYEASVEPQVAYRMSRLDKDGEYDIPKQPVVPYNLDSWKEEKRIIWSSNVASASGFGMVTENVILTLLKLGINVLNPGSITGSLIHGGEFVDKAVEASLNKLIYPDCLEIQYLQPAALKTDIVERIWTYSMFETNHTPKLWIKKLNEVERILVPSQWLVKSWQEQGVNVPIHVFHHGVDPSIYHYLDRPIDREKYTFLQFGELAIRKGTDLLIKAFADEFEGQKDVQLILKTNRPGIDSVPFNDPIKFPKITIIHRSLYSEDEMNQIIKDSSKPIVIVRSSAYSKDQMQQLLFDADCFVFPSRGEGFGLPALEALATGLPTIVTGWSGMADYINQDDTLILDYKMIHADQFDIIYKDHWQDGEEKDSFWAEPNYEQLRTYMRWCYKNRSKAKEMGKKASERIANNWTWGKIVLRELLPLLNAQL